MTIHARQHPGSKPVFVDVWRDSAPPVYVLAESVWREIEKTRSEGARWRLVKDQAIASSKRVPGEKQ